MAQKANKTRALGVRKAVMIAFGFASIGSVLAANNSISMPQISEFGQGVYEIKACDSWVKLDLIPGETGTYGAPAGISPLIGLNISGLDTKACAGTKLTFKARDTGSAELPLYVSSGSKELSSVVLQVLNNSSVSLESSDKYRSLSYSSTTGIYKISFLNPASNAAEVDRLTIESTSL
jgi:hypothetical protein